MAWRGEAWQGEVEEEVEVGARRHRERESLRPISTARRICCWLLLVVAAGARVGEDYSGLRHFYCVRVGRTSVPVCNSSRVSRVRLCPIAAVMGNAAPLHYQHY